jgi:hypothetical protein
LVNFYQTTRCYNPEDSNLHTHRRENLKSYFVKKFLGNTKDPQCEKIVGNMLENLQILGCDMSLKLHFLHFHLDYFPENLDLSEEQGERFHQDIKEK